MSSENGFASTAFLIILTLVLTVGGVGIGLAWKTEYLDKWLPPSVKEMFGRGEEPEEDPTRDWKTYSNEELGIGFKYPSEWETPEVEERSMGECEYQEVYFSKREGAIWIRPKLDSAFLCFQPEPYFECGNYYFECFPPVTSFNCQPYKDESGNYDSMEIWDDLEAQGFDCSITGGRPYAPYIYNPELLQKQFQILEKASGATRLDESLEEEIKSDFILSSSRWRLDSRGYVELIYNSRIEAQGVKIIGGEGSDVSASNFYYRAVFLKGNKIISVSFSLFSFSNELLAWAEKEMDSQIKQGEPFEIIEPLENKTEESPIYEVVQKYDLLVKSIYFAF